MRRLMILVAFACSSCASVGLVKWAGSGPHSVQVPVATIRNSDGTSSTMYESRPNPAQMGKAMSMFFGIIPALVWDVVTFPAQLAMGYPPYGNRK